MHTLGLIISFKIECLNEVPWLDQSFHQKTPFQGEVILSSLTVSPPYEEICVERRAGPWAGLPESHWNIANKEPTDIAQNLAYFWLIVNTSRYKIICSLCSQSSSTITTQSGNRRVMGKVQLWQPPPGGGFKKGNNQGRTGGLEASKP